MPPTIAPREAADILAKPIALAQSGHYSQAEPLVRRHLTRNPDDAGAQYLLGWILMRTRRFEQAAHYLKSAATQNPPQRDALIEYGCALFDTGHPNEGIANLKRAADLFPDSLRSHILLARMLLQGGLFVDAMEACLNAMRLAPENTEVMSLFASAIGGLGRAEESLRWFEKAAMAAPRDIEIARKLAFQVCYAEGEHPLRIVMTHRQYGALALETAPPVPALAPRPDRANRPLRVGILSQDLRGHPVGRFLHPLVRNTDPNGIDLIAYHAGDYTDALTTSLRERFSRWRDIAHTSDADLAAFIIRDQLDILLDLGGLTGGSRANIMAARLAPLQMTYLGYPATTGLPNMDYRIVDAITDPIADESATEPTSEQDLAFSAFATNPDAMSVKHTTETLLRLPACFLCFEPPKSAPTPRRSKRDGIVFGSFNNPVKLTTPALRLWKQVLDAVPNSRLLLKGKGLEEPKCVESFRRRFTQAGLDNTRVDIRTYVDTHVDHLDAYSEIDIALDTFPYNGTTTTCEALWMGVPVVTLAGQMHVSRVGATILINTGLGDFVAHTEGEFVEVAAALATDRTQLETWRSTLRDQIARSPLCDAKAFTKDFWRVVGEAKPVVPSEGVS